jgi:dihydroneopterin aldolase
MPKLKRNTVEQKTAPEAAHDAAVAFHAISAMEDDVQALIDYGEIVARVADTLDSGEDSMVSRLGHQIIECSRSVEDQRAKLFDLLHKHAYPKAQSK